MSNIKNMQKDDKTLQELLELIEIGNLLPPNKDLPTVESLYKQVIKEKTGEEVSESYVRHWLAFEPIEDEYHNEFWLKLIHQLSDHPKFIELLNIEILKAANEPSDFGFVLRDFGSVYAYLVHKAKYIKWIAQYTDNWQKQNEPKENEPKVMGVGATPTPSENLWLEGKEIEDRISNNKIIIRDGKLDFDFDPLAKIVAGKDPERIRICRNCGNIFWAFRLPVEGCSTRCNQNLRVRKLRAKRDKRFDPRGRKDGTL